MLIAYQELGVLSRTFFTDKLQLMEIPPASFILCHPPNLIAGRRRQRGPERPFIIRPSVSGGEKWESGTGGKSVERVRNLTKSPTRTDNLQALKAIAFASVKASKYRTGDVY